MKKTIYNNYDLTENYTDEELKEVAIDCGWVDEDDEITDDMLWDWRYQEDELDWENEWYELKKFFEGKTVLFLGMVGRWTGHHEAGKIGEFENLFYDALTDCHYFKVEDDNGHLYLTCSHHDGTNHFEIKEVTNAGKDYYERWEYGNDNRQMRHVHKQIFKRYSRRPNFWKTVYGG